MISHFFLFRRYRSRTPSLLFSDTHIARVSFLPPRGLTYHREQSNATHICADETSRHTRDPYEAQFIDARQSNVSFYSTVLIHFNSGKPHFPITIKKIK